MKLYVGYIKDANKKTVSVLSLTDDKGVVLHTAKKIQGVDLERFEIDLMSIKWGILKIKSLMQNGVIPTEPINIFISNATVYEWLDKKIAPNGFIGYIGDIYLELSFMGSSSEIILSSLVDKKLKMAYKKALKEVEGIKASDLLKDIVM